MLGARSSLITSSRLRLSRESRIPLVRLNQIEPLAIHSPLIRTSKLLSARTEQPEIGWDNWNPLDASFDLDRFDATIDRDSLSENRMEDRLDRLDSLEDRNLDFFTTILAPESVANTTPDLIQQNDNNSSVIQDDLKITTSPGRKRAKSQKQSKSSNLIHKSPDLVKVDRSKAREILPETTAQIHSEIAPPHSHEVGVERKTIDESASESPTDNLQLTPLSIQTNINRSTLLPSLQPDATPTPFNQLEVNTESASESPTDNLQLTPLSIQTNINRSTLLPSLPPDATPTPSDERGVDIESTNELRPDNLPPSLFSTTIIINDPLADLPTDASIDVENRLTEITNDSDRLIGKNSATNSNLKASNSSDLQAEELLSSPVAPLKEDPIAPTPVQGYATGGYVKESDRVNPESIAASDTVAAMLTPGEFVINAKDAQKNLDLITHINRGGEPDKSIASNQHIIEFPVERKTSTVNLQTFIQPKSHEPLISNSLQSEVNLHQISFLNNPQLNTFENSPSRNNLAATNYASPALIFRKPQSSNQASDGGFDRTPDEWGNIEELMNGGNNKSDIFNFNDFNPAQSSSPNNDVNNYHSVPASPNIALKHLSSARGFADGGEVTPADVSIQAEPITVTIEAPSSNNRTRNNDTAELEILAREIYHRLRQRLEIERERHGSYSGNLSW